MALKLAQPLWVRTCPTCEGRGTVPCPRSFSTRTFQWVAGCYVPNRIPGEGAPIPCPECKGKKVVAS